MFAIVRSGNKQYRAVVGKFFKVEKLEVSKGEKVTLNEVLAIFEDGKNLIGKPLIDGAGVVCEVLDHTRDDKVIIFKKKRRANYRRKRGHKQHKTIVKVLEILSSGVPSSDTLASTGGVKKAGKSNKKSDVPA